MWLEDEKDQVPTLVAIPYDKAFGSDEVCNAIREAFSKDYDLDRIVIPRRLGPGGFHTKFPDPYEIFPGTFPGLISMPLRMTLASLDQNRFNQKLAEIVQAGFVWRVFWKKKNTKAEQEPGEKRKR